LISIGTTNNSATTASTTPFLDPIQQQIHQHELLKKVTIMNKELKLPRTQPANKNTRVPLENVTNLLGAVTNVLPLDANGNKIRPNK
jgi:hypothetical protein